MARVQNVRDGGQGGQKHLGTNDARQGARTGYMWRVLGLSVLLGAVVVLAAWLWVAGGNPHLPPGERGQVAVVAAPPQGPPPATAPASQVVGPMSQSHAAGS